MLHYVHQLVTNFVRLLFGAWQVGYSGILENFFAENSCLLCMETALIREARVNQNSQAVGRKATPITLHTVI